MGAAEGLAVRPPLRLTTPGEEGGTRAQCGSACSSLGAGSAHHSALPLDGTPGGTKLSSEEGSHARGRCHALRRYGVWEWEGEVEMGACSEGRVRDSQSAGGGQALTTVTRVTIYPRLVCAVVRCRSGPAGARLSGGSGICGSWERYLRGAAVRRPGSPKWFTSPPEGPLTALQVCFAMRNWSGPVGSRLVAESGAFGGRERRPNGSAVRRRAALPLCHGVFAICRCFY